MTKTTKQQKRQKKLKARAKAIQTKINSANCESNKMGQEPHELFSDNPNAKAWFGLTDDDLTAYVNAKIKGGSSINCILYPVESDKFCQALKNERNIDAEVGDWMVDRRLGPDFTSLELLGPFDTFDEAKLAASEKFGATTFRRESNGSMTEDIPDFESLLGLYNGDREQWRSQCSDFIIKHGYAVKHDSILNKVIERIVSSRPSIAAWVNTAPYDEVLLYAKENMGQDIFNMLDVSFEMSGIM